MIASLPMYDWPEVRAATDSWWQGLSRHAGVTLELDRTADYAAAWRLPDLAFSQTCGYPFTHEFKDKLAYVATPHYAVQGCEGALYSSFLFAREAAPIAELKGCRGVINGRDSMSGMLALKAVVAPHATSGRFFREVVVSGSHRNSLAMVQRGDADLCAIDCVAVGLARTYVPSLLQGLVQVAQSPMVPALPFVTRAMDVARWRAALSAAFADDTLKPARQALFLAGFSILSAADYDAILRLEQRTVLDDF